MYNYLVMSRIYASEYQSASSNMGPNITQSLHRFNALTFTEKKKKEYRIYKENYIYNYMVACV